MRNLVLKLVWIVYGRPNLLNERALSFPNWWWVWFNKRFEK